MNEPDVTTPEGSEESSGTRRGVLGFLRTPLGGVVIVALLALFPLIWAMRAPAPRDDPPPPILSRLPAFELVDQSGAVRGSEQLRGRPWVASVFFARCPSVCPALMAEIKGLETVTRLSAPGALFVSFSADATHDTPEVLRAYMEEQGLEGERFVLLTGEEERVREVVLEGLKLGLGEDGEAPFGIFHATHVVLVDAQLNVRGYYRSDSQAELDRLVRDLIALERLRG